jgi:hypothetical protein
LSGMCRRGQNDQNAESNLYTQESLSRVRVFGGL